ncbi:MAG: xseA [Rickettsiaceae bacterium]|jgi:exodeoxyribonuclease VII large subunit|nr:xseA [Rickettsiaceae bacterium]
MQDLNYKSSYIQNTLTEQQNLSNVAEFSVSEISSAIKRLVEENFEYVRVRGEISGLKIAASGHAYFNLKDASSVLACTCWRHSMAKISIRPEDGLEVVAIGKITTYAGQSKYQMTVESIEIAGIGALMQQFERLKAAFIKEGLFAPERKKQIPFFPKTIAVVTSMAGAVIRDIWHRIEDRCPVRLIIWPVAVQGQTAAGEIAEAIKGFNAYEALNLPKADVIIVARGGGSIEDLWAFNEEIVVRAAANSHIPLISAVGHETDFTLIDFAADLRAPTPTAAAELAVPVFNQLKASIIEADYKLITSITKYLNLIQHQYRCQANALPDALALILNQEQRLDDLYIRLQESLPKLLAIKSLTLSRFPLSIISPERVIMMKKQKLENEARSLRNSLSQSVERKLSKLLQLASAINTVRLQNSLNQKITNYDKFEVYLLKAITRIVDNYYNKLNMHTRILESLDYKKVLKRGFAIIKSEEGRVLSSSAQAKGSIAIEFHDGKVKAEVR